MVPGRYDIGRHFFLTGGLSGSKETYEKLLSSIWSFYQVLPKSFIDTNPMMQKMFKKPEYLKAMNTLCGTNGNDFYFRPLQVNYYLIVIFNFGPDKKKPANPRKIPSAESQEFRNPRGGDRDFKSSKNPESKITKIAIRDFFALGISIPGIRDVLGLRIRNF